MDQATAQHKPETAPRPHRPTQAKAARAYQKAQLTEATEEEILETYAPVISQMVHRFVPLVRVTVDVDDLKNIASLALIQAAHGFDPVAGMSFESYARMRIRGRFWMRSANPNHSHAQYIRAAKSWKLLWKPSAWN